MTVLVAEDHEVNMKIICFMLSKLDCQVIQAVNGKEAVSSFREQKPELVLMDLRMPEMDGLEATREIRKIDSNVPISALSANSSEQDRLDAKSAGMNYFITKPVKIETLKKLLDNLDDFSPDDKSEVEDMGASVLDLDSVTEVFSGKRDIALSMLKEFLEGLPALLEKIHKFSEQEDYPALESAAHSLKGQLLNLHAEKASMTLAALEQSAREGNKKAIEDACKQCDNSMAVLTEKIKTYLTT